MTSSEARMLAERGTKAYFFTPSCILSVARLDLLRRAENVQLAKEKRDAAMDGTMSRYAFLGIHVRKAKNAAHLIELALAHGCAMATTKLNTIRLYADRDALQGALDLCAPQEVAAGSYASSETTPVVVDPSGGASSLT